PAGLAACLLNPHFFRVFTLPPELVPAVWASELRRDPRFCSWVLSPWQWRDYLEPTAGLSARGLAYFALAALGVMAFALRAFLRQGLVGWRLLVWGAFALLGAWQVRGIPFFAVVAGPITALNLQDVVVVAGARAAGRTRSQLLAGAARATLLASGLGLV